MTNYNNKNFEFVDNSYPTDDYGDNITEQENFTKDLCASFIKGKKNDSLKKILKFMKHDNNKAKRIFYSQINVYIANRKAEERELFIYNIILSLNYIEHNNIDDINKTLNVNIEEDECDEIIKILLKIYDHINLIGFQKDNTNNIVGKAAKDLKEENRKEIDKIQRDYISILGIFASIILAFVGGMTFSSSVLANMHQNSIYKMITVSTILGFILISLFYVLTYFILLINNFENKLKKFFKIYTDIVKILFAILSLTLIIRLIKYIFCQI